MSDPNEWNASIIAEFRKNHGKVGDYFEGAPLLLLHHTGARSGKARLNPVMYLKNGDRYLIFASKGGADSNPDWYYNIKVHPDVQIEIGDETIDARARRRLLALSAIRSTNAKLPSIQHSLSTNLRQSGRSL
jgi:deazaflavin-dependent oxidoreductase (nitroreductase family)